VHYVKYTPTTVRQQRHFNECQPLWLTQRRIAAVRRANAAVSIAMAAAASMCAEHGPESADDPTPGHQNAIPRVSHSKNVAFMSSSIDKLRQSIVEASKAGASFTVGMVAGKFYPVHLGHQSLIRFGKEGCDLLIAIVAHRHGDQIPGSIRTRWLQELSPVPSASFQDVLAKARSCRRFAGVVCPVWCNDDIPNSSEAWAIRGLKIADEFGQPQVHKTFGSEPYLFEWASRMSANHCPIQRVVEGHLQAPEARSLRLSLADNWDALVLPAKKDLCRCIHVVGTEHQFAMAIAARLKCVLLRHGSNAKPQESEGSCIERSDSATGDRDGLSSAIWFKKSSIEWSRRIGAVFAWNCTQLTDVSSIASCETVPFARHFVIAPTGVDLGPIQHVIPSAHIHQFPFSPGVPLTNPSQSVLDFVGKNVDIPPLFYDYNIGGEQEVGDNHNPQQSANQLSRQKHARDDIDLDTDK